MSLAAEHIRLIFAALTRRHMFIPAVYILLNQVHACPCMYETHSRGRLIIISSSLPLVQLQSFPQHPHLVMCPSHILLPPSCAQFVAPNLGTSMRHSITRLYAC